MQDSAPRRSERARKPSVHVRHPYHSPRYAQSVPLRKLKRASAAELHAPEQGPVACAVPVPCVQPGACELLDSALHVIDRAETRMSALQLARRHASDQRWAELLAEEQLARDRELAEAEALLLPLQPEFQREREEREAEEQRELDWENQQAEWAERDREQVLRAPTESLNSTQKSTQDHFYAERMFFPYANYAQSRWPEYVPVPELRETRGGCARASDWRPTVDMRHPHPVKREPAVVSRA